jgi:hypothetical protein
MSGISRLNRSEVTPEMAALYDNTFVYRFNNALMMEPTKPGEGGCAA